MQAGYECISLAFHPFGSALAAGSSEGHLIVVNAETGSTMLTLRVCGSPLNCLEYNQIGDMVAIGSQNGKFQVMSLGTIKITRYLFCCRIDLHVQSISRRIFLQTRE